jgi:hypothetical protein
VTLSGGWVVGTIFVVNFWVSFATKEMIFQFSEENKLAVFPRSAQFKLFWIIVVLPVG